MPNSWVRQTLAALILASGCTGSILDPGTWRLGEDKPVPDPTPIRIEPEELLPALPMPVAGVRRLSRDEYDATVRDLLGDDTRPGSLRFSEDATTPFDNDVSTQLAGPALIGAAETLAEEIAQRALAKPLIRARLVPCTPTGPGDAVCMKTFVTHFGRSALRRPLRPDEVTRFMALQSFAVEAADFYFGVELVLRAMLQEVEFLYRVDLGAPTDEPGVYLLNDFELASRLSFLILGTTPDEAVLNLAELGQLHSPEQVRAAAAAMLGDKRAHAQVERFHALWLGFAKLPDPALAPEFRAETAALIENSVFAPGAHYFDLFTSSQTFVSSKLATYYGLPAPSNPAGAWVPYGTNPRRGILSQGSFLSANAKFDDTSPTRRGKFIRERLLCQVVLPPPPNVNADVPPVGVAGKSNCKIDRYSEHRTNASCAGCHAQLDPIGFGLENYDRLGKYRAADAKAPECTISGEGEVKGIGTFNGPGGLGTLLASDAALQQCVVTQMVRFAMGRGSAPEDSNLVKLLAKNLAKSGAFQDLLLDLVSEPAFARRKQL
jgi:hypothetical protein